MKGYLYTLEAMIAALLILSTLVFIYQPQQKTSFDFSILKDSGLACLKDLDNRGLLRYYALNNMTQQMRSSLQNCLPRTANFSVGLCTDGCSLDVPKNKTSVAVYRFISGEAATFQPMTINLAMWSLQ